MEVRKRHDILAATAISLLWMSPSMAVFAADAARGKTVFEQRCLLCHVAEEGDRGGGQGPSLQGVVGRKSASAAGFGYSRALRGAQLTWDAKTLDHYLMAPSDAVPGTTMPIMTPSKADRDNVIAYLSTLKAPASQTASTISATFTQSTSAVFGDWRTDAPGMVRHIKPSDLPKPYATPSVRNGSQVVDRPANAKLSVPKGFKVDVFTKELDGPRVVRVAPNGDIFVSETSSDRVRVLRATDGAPAPSQTDVFASGLDRPFGIAFYPLGENPQWVYVANRNSVVRFAYRSGDLKARGKPQIVVPKLSKSSGGHSTRDIAFSRDGSRLFVSVGSGSNVAEKESRKSPEDIQAWDAKHGLGAAWGDETLRADVLVFDPEGRQPAKIFATGIRNCVGLNVHADTGDVWCTVNERDGLGDDLVPDYSTRVREGHFYGWPWYFMGQFEDPRHKGVRPDLAGKATVPDVLFQPHSAALTLTFYPDTPVGPSAFPAEYRGDAFVALHGSWNRTKRTGYKVVRLPLDKGVPTGAYEDFMTGFVVDDNDVWGRPVGVAVAHDGALLVSDDGGDLIWRIAPDRQP